MVKNAAKLTLGVFFLTMSLSGMEKKGFDDFMLFEDHSNDQGVSNCEDTHHHTVKWGNNTFKNSNAKCVYDLLQIIEKSKTTVDLAITSREDKRLIITDKDLKLLLKKLKRLSLEKCELALTDDIIDKIKNKFTDKAFVKCTKSPKKLRRKKKQPKKSNKYRIQNEQDNKKPVGGRN